MFVKFNNHSLLLCFIAYYCNYYVILEDKSLSFLLVSSQEKTDSDMYIRGPFCLRVVALRPPRCRIHHLGRWEIQLDASKGNCSHTEA